MQLTKEELQFIDTYLKNSSVTLVDVRLEMVDHIASEIEAKIEARDQDNFYDAFKVYMIKGKKSLLAEYEKHRVQRFDKVLMKTLKTFLDKDVLLFGVISFALVFTFKDFFVSYFQHNILLVVPAFLLYFILFKGAIRTSIAVALVVAMILPVYIWFYFRNPYLLIMVLGAYLLFKAIVKMFEDKLTQKRKTQMGTLFVVLFYAPMYLMGPKQGIGINNTVVELAYVVFQMMHWYVVFKQIFRC